MAQYLHASLFSPKTARPLKANREGLLKTWIGLIEKLTRKHLEKPINITLGHLHTRSKLLQ